MPVPVSQMYTVASYLLKQKLRGETHYPLVLMLEPLFRCNLACAGCGKIQYPAEVLKRHLSYEDCMQAVAECPAPVVSLPGGEPLMHPEIDRIVEGLVERKKYIYLCTNGLLLEEKLDLFEPSKYLSFSVHLDGLEEEHDLSVCRTGTYETALRGIRKALERGFRVTTNTTFFEGVDPERCQRFFDEMMDIGVEGMMISPGYSYSKAADQQSFLGRERTKNLFRRLFGSPGFKRWRFNQSPLFLEFLAGARDYDCMPWGNPTYSVFGWQKPCYLLQDGYEKSFADLIEKTEWSQYGPASGNPACQDCMVHSGFEASAVDEAFSSLGGMLQMIRATLFGARIPAVSEEPVKTLASVIPVESASRGFGSEATPAALRAAFEYRGDVTLTLDDGQELEGFVANLNHATLDLWPAGVTDASEIPTERIRRVDLSGRDPASEERRESTLRKRERVRARATP
ncbi:MAG: adenosyl-hopene transferase HpnH [Deltaproteobacteria bacterium]|nr:adenosyl-hopene transferase HpnH [Deltaproteobacteria bacterium]MBW2417860.1 adenosyl-hopene transferase HpnH [Deltaproteobacteria bacterium]